MKKILPIILFGAAILLFLPQKAGATNYIIQPDGDIQANLSVVPTANATMHWESVNDASINKNDYVANKGTTNYVVDLYSLTQPSDTDKATVDGSSVLVKSGAIDKITVFAVLSVSTKNKGWARIYIKTAGADNDWESSDITLTDTSSKSYSESWEKNPVTGEKWTWDEINTLQAGIKLKSDSSSITVKCYNFYVLVDYGVLPAEIVTNAASSINDTFATLNGKLTKLGGHSSANVFFEYGPTDSYGNLSSAETITKTGNFSEKITGLAAHTTYYFRAVAENGSGIFKAAPLSFTTKYLSETSKGDYVYCDTYSSYSYLQLPAGTNCSSNIDGLCSGLCQAKGWNGGGYPIECRDNSKPTYSSKKNCIINENNYSAISKVSSGGTDSYIKCWCPMIAPTVNNGEGATNILGDAAILNGEVLTNGGENPTVHIYWGTIDGKTTAASWQHDENLGQLPIGDFSKDVNLSPNTTYYYRVYAENEAGKTWADNTASFSSGNVVNNNKFILRPNGDGYKTSLVNGWAEVNDGKDTSYVYEEEKTKYVADIYNLDDIINDYPSLTINKITIYFRAKSEKISTSRSAKAKDLIYIGNKIYEGEEKTLTESYTDYKGHIYPFNPITQNAWEWSDLNDLQAGVELKNEVTETSKNDYWVRCSEVWVEVDFSADGIFVPMLHTTGGGGLTYESALLKGELNNLGGTDSDEVWFEYGQTAALGQETEHQIKNSTGEFSINIYDLISNTTYYFRAAAKNSAGTSYGATLSFKTALQTQSDEGNTPSICLEFVEFSGDTNQCSGTNSSGQNINQFCQSLCQASGQGDNGYAAKCYDVAGEKKNCTDSDGDKACCKKGGELFSSCTVNGVSYFTSDLENFNKMSNACFANTYVKCWCAIYELPTIANKDVTNKTVSSATLNAQITSTGGDNPKVHIFWGTTNCGNNLSCWQDPTKATDINLGKKGAETVSTDISGLTSGTTYYYTSYAENASGYVLGDSVESFVASDQTAAPYCGDGSCNNNETCSSCSTDCGACSSNDNTNDDSSSDNNSNNTNTQTCNDSQINMDDLKTYTVGSRMVAYDGLVPCGKCSLVDVAVDADGNISGGTPTNISCQLCHLFVMIKGIMDFVMFTLVPVVAVLLLTVGGVMYLVSRGDPGMLTQAMSIIKATCIGLVIIYGAWIIVNTVMTFTDMASWTGDFQTKWFEINCSITLPN